MHQEANQTLPLPKINENKVRLTAFWVLLSVLVYLFTHLAFIPVFLVLDFALRSFDLGKYSPFACLSDAVVGALKLGAKPIFYPPKRFAARIGLLFSVSILILQVLQIDPLLVGGVLAFFAALESLAGICAGCYVYDWLSPFWQKRG
jgi:hypothetical protein